MESLGQTYCHHLRLGTDPRARLVFEDALTGIEEVFRAGMRAAALTTTQDGREFHGFSTIIQVAKDFTSMNPRSLLAVLRSVKEDQAEGAGDKPEGCPEPVAG